MYTRSIIKDIDMTALLKMRDEELLSYEEIAGRIGCSKQTLYRIIGPTPPETKAKRAALRGKWTSSSKGGYTVERKMQSYKPQREEPAPVKAVLAVKKAPIRLCGAFLHYTICPGRELIEAETAEGRVLVQIPADMLGTFIEELTAIQKNIGQAEPMQVWG